MVLNVGCVCLRLVCLVCEEELCLGYGMLGLGAIVFVGKGLCLALCDLFVDISLDDVSHLVTDFVSL